MFAGIFSVHAIWPRAAIGLRPSDRQATVHVRYVSAHSLYRPYRRRLLVSFLVS